MVLLRLGDSGPGVPAELAERITLPFEGLDGSRGRHGGWLALENGAEGGLVATVALPAAPAN